MGKRIVVTAYKNGKVKKVNIPERSALHREVTEYVPFTDRTAVAGFDYIALEDSDSDTTGYLGTIGVLLKTELEDAAWENGIDGTRERNDFQEVIALFTQGGYCLKVSDSMNSIYSDRKHTGSEHRSIGNWGKTITKLLETPSGEILVYAGEEKIGCIKQYEAVIYK